MTETEVRAKVVAQAVSWLGKKESDGTRTATAAVGIANLVAKGIINSPDYWIANVSVKCVPVLR